MELTWLLRQPVVKGALAGLLSAVLVDLRALRASPHGLDGFDLKVAVIHWAIGAISGASMALGIQEVS